MRVYKIELMVLDFDQIGDDIPATIEEARYPNRCISPKVMSVETREIGEWDDSNSLNNTNTMKARFNELFAAASADRREG